MAAIVPEVRSIPVQVLLVKQSFDKKLRTAREVVSKVEKEVNDSLVKHAQQIEKLTEKLKEAKTEQTKAVEAAAQRLRDSEEYKKFVAAKEEFDEWLAKLCSHYGCRVKDIDWEKEEVKVLPSEILPEALTKVPV